ncbi:MAG TPA: FGGY family carbohydrate kinase [Actinomycetes bacterium]|jgi:gluconokinase|nr:FGGY family carbohydrate kinase [Actinomycetes bacterium]
MQEPRVLALDLGTSSVRALLFDRHGRAVPDALARRATRLEVADDGRAELDPGAVVAAVCDCLDELSQRGQLRRIGEVAMSCAWHSVIAADVDGRPLTGALTWADTRAAWLVDELRRRTDPSRLQAATGAVPHATYWTVKIPWLARSVRPAPARYLGLAEYVSDALLGEPRASISQASGTGLLDLASLRWHAQALELAGVDETAVPELMPPNWSGGLRDELARRWPALADATWHEPVGDGAASNVGAGCVTPDRIAMNLGTSAAVRAVHEEPTPLTRALWRYRVDRRRLLTGAAFSGAGNLYAWARKVLALPSDDEVEAALAAVPPGAEGVVVMPYHAGSRAPLDLVAGSGVIAGISMATTAVEIVAAMLEAVCFQLADGVEALERSLGAEPGSLELVASGGAVVASRWWQQTLANVLGRPVRVVDEPEASARGAALLALGLDAEPQTRHVVEPEPDGVRAEQEARAVYRALAEQLGYV